MRKGSVFFFSYVVILILLCVAYVITMSLCQVLREIKEDHSHTKGQEWSSYLLGVKKVVLVPFKVRPQR